MKETVHLFGRSRSLVGVLSEPDQGGAGPDGAGFVFLNSGILHRVGPNRLYVQIARALAERGCCSLRFDFSGIGDSRAREGSLPFEESALAETRAAMDHLAALKGLRRFVLSGICSGAIISFRTAEVDPRVSGLVLINGQGFRREDLASYIQERIDRHYHWRVKFSPASWRRLLWGVSSWGRLFRSASLTVRELACRGAPQESPPQNDPGLLRAFGALISRGVDIRLIYSEGDTGLDYLKVILGEKFDELPGLSKFELTIVPGADHRFTLLRNQAFLLGLIAGWAEDLGRG